VDVTVTAFIARGEIELRGALQLASLCAGNGPRLQESRELGRIREKFTGDR
jgi:hypothetical protein